MRYLPLVALAVLSGCQGAPAHSLCSDFDCSGRGTCKLVQAQDGELTPTCVCDPGYAPSVSGWHCLPTSVAVSDCKGVTCSGHGTCVSLAGAASCRCDAGYKTGRDTETCESVCTGVSCSGHGSCRVLASGSTWCECDAGYRNAIDGKSCTAIELGTYRIYGLFYDKYSTWQMGKLTVDLTDLSSGKVQELFNNTYDYYQRLYRTGWNRWTLDSAGKQAQALELDEVYTQRRLYRTRYYRTSQGPSGGSLTVGRAGKQATLSPGAAGSLAPLPMPGAREYPGRALGCLSPVFYMLAYKRYDATTRGAQKLPVLWPDIATSGTVTVQAHSSWTAAKPVLQFPEQRVTVTYTSDGLPEKVQLESRAMSLTHITATPSDVNLAQRTPGTAVTVTPPPTGAIETELSITSADKTVLSATLARPSSGGSALPAVLLVSDLRAHDRDATIRELPSLPLYKHLAAHLAAAGYASLRYDARSRGSSQGSASSATLARLVEDAQAALSALRGSSGIDGKRVYLLSHGMSSLVALTVLGKDSTIKGYLGLAPVLQDVDKALTYRVTEPLKVTQFSSKEISDFQKSFSDQMDEITKGTYKGTTWLDLPVAYWKDALAFKGLATLTTYSGPVLLLRGDQDLEVPKEQLSSATSAATTAGKKNLTSTTLAGITFGFAAGKKSDLWETAALPLEVPKSTVSAITDWLKKN
jgi:hypothetical protein